MTIEMDYFYPHNKELMQLFLDSLDVGDTIPYGLIGVRNGLLPSGDEDRTNFDDLLERIYKPVRLKAQNLQDKIKRYFKKYKNQYLAVATRDGVLCILRGESGRCKRKHNHLKGKELIIESHRGLQQQIHRQDEGLTREQIMDSEKYLLRNAELYNQTQSKAKTVIPSQPKTMIRLLPPGKIKYAC